jgi:hypothetical protein
MTNPTAVAEPDKKDDIITGTDLTSLDFSGLSEPVEPDAATPEPAKSDDIQPVAVAPDKVASDFDAKTVAEGLGIDPSYLDGATSADEVGKTLAARLKSLEQSHKQELDALKTAVVPAVAAPQAQPEAKPAAQPSEFDNFMTWAAAKPEEARQKYHEALESDPINLHLFFVEGAIERVLAKRLSPIEARVAEVSEMPQRMAVERELMDFQSKHADWEANKSKMHKTATELEALGLSVPFEDLYDIQKVESENPEAFKLAFPLVKKGLDWKVAKEYAELKTKQAGIAKVDEQVNKVKAASGSTSKGTKGTPQVVATTRLQDIEGLDEFLKETA